MQMKAAVLIVISCSTLLIVVIVMAVFISKPTKSKTPSTSPQVQTAKSAKCFCLANEEIILSEVDQSQNVTTPGYPDPYCSDINCSWKVTTLEGLFVKVEWMVFNLEKYGDFVYVYDVKNGRTSKRLAACTGPECSSEVSSANQMQLQFISDHVNNLQGFRARVTAVKTGPQDHCKRRELESANMLGTISYGIMNENGDIPIGAMATLTCPKGAKIKGTKDIVYDHVTCKSGGWSRKLHACILIYKYSKYSMDHPDGILLIGGRNHAQHKIDLYYPPKDALYSMELSLKTGRWGSVSVQLNDHKVIVAGGFNEYIYKELSSTEILDLASNQITDGPKLKTGRSDAAGAKFYANVVICGGFSRFILNILSSCEVYSPISNTWSPFTSMTTTRQSHGMVTLAGCLYAVGGMEDISDEYCLKTVEKFCSDGWQAVANMNVEHCSHGTAVLGDNIFVCGGYTFIIHERITMECEMYVVEDDQWKSIPALKEERGRLAMAAYSGRLYAFGGMRLTKDWFAFIEEYNPEKETWSLLHFEEFYKIDSSAVVIG